MKNLRKLLIKTVIQLIPSIIWMIIIFYFSSKTGQESSVQSDSIVDKILLTTGISVEFTHLLVVIVRKSAHILEYLILFLLIFFGLKDILTNRKNFIVSSICSLLYAFLDEFHQLFSQGRSAELKDILIDSIGILLGMILIQFVLIFKNKRNS